jgi:hypothetical protein
MFEARLCRAKSLRWPVAAINGGTSYDPDTATIKKLFKYGDNIFGISRPQALSLLNNGVP